MVYLVCLHSECNSEGGVL